MGVNCIKGLTNITYLYSLEPTLALFGHSMFGVIFRLMWNPRVLNLLGEQPVSLFIFFKQSKTLSQLEPISFFVALLNLSRDN
ncbi:hypothetical protein Sps_02778 [Shewanella psychrophila]|uniref:Uncharacterized protein n=1 Tax=Shewanella psychrophila TaxID=225848 RepID=A0A1S6HQX8_9GAMM|nr:hypothetical protein Sps_02778 [Shewanella psychrophila]